VADVELSSCTCRLREYGHVVPWSYDSATVSGVRTPVDPLSLLKTSTVAPDCSWYAQMAALLLGSDVGDGTSHVVPSSIDAAA